MKNVFLSGSAPFIVIEGINGSGKSSQVARMEVHFRALNKPLLVVREPGSSELGEKIRDIVRFSPEEIHINAQIALFLASRVQLAFTKIIPALQRGITVISDRWIQSTLAYQCSQPDSIKSFDYLQIANLFLHGLTPDATIVLDIPVLQALERRKKLEDEGDHSDRFEKKGIKFQEELALQYKVIASSFPRHSLVDGEGSLVEVHNRVETAIQRILEDKFF